MAHEVRIRNNQSATVETRRSHEEAKNLEHSCWLVVPTKRGAAV